MSEVLVLIDHSEGSPSKLSLQTLNAGRRLAEPAGDDVVAVWLGPGATAVAERLGDHGADRLLHWDNEDATGYVTVPQVDALEQAIADRDASALLFASTNHQKDVASRLAIRLGTAGVITDCTDLEVGDGDVAATKEVFGGDTITTSRVADGAFPIYGVAANAFTAEYTGAGAPEIHTLDVEMSEDATAATVTDVEIQADAERPDPGEAAIIVSGGRGLGEAEGFDLIEEVADELGAAVGASRAATDAGWYPHRHQIGQTGRTVSPMLYMANGISGAIQHRAGMQTSQHIVTVNTDPEAPIFQITDFGVVGDLYDVLPALLEEVRARRD